MTIQSRWTVDVPRCSLAQWIFGSACDPLPNHKSFIDPDDPDNNFLTMPHFRLLAKRVSLGLLRAGLQKGDRVLLFSGNSLLFPSVFLGILMAGGIVTGANPSFVPRELAYQLQDSGATFLFAAEQALDTAFAAAKEAGLSKDRVFVLGPASVPVKELATASSPAQGPAAGSNKPVDLAGARHWTELLRLGGSPAQAEAWRWEEPANPEETTCCLNYSSGTTGVPKGVEISHYSYVANGVGVVHTTKLHPDFAQKQQTDSGLAFLPFYHTYGQTYFIANMPHLHIPVYVMPAFDFVKMLTHIQRFRITTLAVVPPIVVLLAKHPAVKQFDLSSVETIGSGAAPLSLEVCEEVQRQFTASTSPSAREFRIRQGWGMTELTCTALSWDPTSPIPTSSGVGELSPNCAAQLVSLETGQPITTPNTPGELWVTGPTLMRRYWRKPQATADTITVDTNGTRWLRTGDIAYIEAYRAGGIVHVVDRVKELIKVKGNQVAPAELEGVLLENPEVADAAVVGVTIGGEEVPRAYVVRRAGSKVTEAEVAGWMEGKVVRYKRLKGGVVFVEGIPKNPSGKILRKQLRDRAREEVGDTAPKTSRL
ncbi:uncharacterized protein C8A04DRAFT_39222 [Dichotomopilus funicola]|uniref:Uncharacterized protein n=1 Tax=Dichotomopilus funicola TaxID=1934379 RepID=A0AAN6UYD2_9PEZI|nr:hypothetical protein C8A04DRAFT_39222 [Dichotomopilus funicola]